MKTRNRTKKSPVRDWHNADIVAALRKAGWSLRSLSVHHGFNPGSLCTAMNKDRGWPLAEELIAAAIASGDEYPGITPADIWPSRYGENITPRRRRSHVKPAPATPAADTNQPG